MISLCKTDSQLRSTFAIKTFFVAVTESKRNISIIAICITPCKLT